MRISDWSSDVCSSDLIGASDLGAGLEPVIGQAEPEVGREVVSGADPDVGIDRVVASLDDAGDTGNLDVELAGDDRSEERSVGKECVSTCRSRWSPSPYKKKNI